MEKNQARLQYDEEEEVGLLNDPKNSAIVPERVKTFDPESHLANKECFESLNCLVDYSLTVDERIAFYQVKNSFSVMYDDSNQQHKSKLKELTDIVFKNEAKEIIDNDYVSDKWGIFGFQGKDPRTDFRGGGLEGLRQFVEFSRRKQDVFKKMVELTDKGLFMMACNSISVSFYIKEYYHMGTNVSITKKEGKLSTRPAFKGFCSMIQYDPKSTDRLHHLLLESIFNIWLEATSKNPDLTIMDMSEPENLIKAHFVKVSSKGLGEFTFFEQHFRENMPTSSQIKKRKLL